MRQLLWGEGSIAERYDAFRRAIKGLGAASITEIMAFVHPGQCGLWNDKACKALVLLGFRDSFPLVRKAQLSGREYEEYNSRRAG